jgi:hypothetical protein
MLIDIFRKRAGQKSVLQAKPKWLFTVKNFKSPKFADLKIFRQVAVTVITVTFSTSQTYKQLSDLQLTLKEITVRR